MPKLAVSDNAGLPHVSTTSREVKKAVDSVVHKTESGAAGVKDLGISPSLPFQGARRHKVTELSFTPKHSHSAFGLSSPTRKKLPMGKIGPLITNAGVDGRRMA